MRKPSFPASLLTVWQQYEKPGPKRGPKRLESVFQAGFYPERKNGKIRTKRCKDCRKRKLLPARTDRMKRSDILSNGILFLKPDERIFQITLIDPVFLCFCSMFSGRMKCGWISVRIWLWRLSICSLLVFSACQSHLHTQLSICIFQTCPISGKRSLVR